MFLIGLLLSVSVSHAVLSADQRECNMRPVQLDQFVPANVKKQTLELCMANKKSKADAANLKSQISSLKDKEQECFKDERSMWGRLTNKAQRTPSSTDVARCEAERTKKEAQLSELENSLKMQDQQLRVAEESYKTQAGTAKATAEEKAKVDNLVNREFDTMKLSIFDQKLQAADAALKLQKMATALDNSAMGLYLRDRMAGLLNSDVMCSAVKACPKPRAIKGSELNSVFNSSMNTGVDANREVTSGAAAGTTSQPAVKTNK